MLVNISYKDRRIGKVVVYSFHRLVTLERLLMVRICGTPLLLC